MKAFRFACGHINNLYQYYTHQDRTRKIKRAAKLVFEFTLIIMKMLTRLSQPECQEFKNCISHYLRQDEGWQNSELPARIIHWACGSGRKSHIFPKIDVIRLLLEAGIDPNAVDKDGNSPLLIVSQWPYCYDFGITGVKMLLDAGAHLDQANNVCIYLSYFSLELKKSLPFYFSFLGRFISVSRLEEKAKKRA